jgi:hypothetical protein
MNTNIYSYLETSGGQSSNTYLNVVLFSTPVLIRQLWQLKTVVFLHWCLICIALFNDVLKTINDKITASLVKKMVVLEFLSWTLII